MTQTPSSAFGMNLPVLAFRESAVVGVAPWGALSRTIPDPMQEESAAGQKAAKRAQREHKALRDDVQRLLKGSAKGRNVERYARYIAEGLRGDRKNRWSTPPLCLWSSHPLHEVEGSQYERMLPITAHVVAVDAETQVCALHRISDDPEGYGLTPADIDELIIPFEMYWNLTAADARQIFHDRNWYGVQVDKNLALSMDQFDLATQLTQRLLDEVHVSVNGTTTPLRPFVNTNKRQLGASSPEWITLSSLRSLVVTTLLGSHGIGATASAVSEGDLDIPDGVGSEQMADQVVDVLGSMITRRTADFVDRSAITTPACLAGIGVVAHRVMPWGSDQPTLTRHEFLELLDSVVWERRADVWDGIAGRRTTSGGITFGGGAKDSGSKVAEAVLHPRGEAGRQIRGLGATTAATPA